MKIPRALALFLSIVMAAGSVPQTAAAQVIGPSASAGASGVTGVIPRIELGSGFTLSPAPSMSPSLLGGIPTLNAPSISAPQSVHPFAALPALPPSALAAPQVAAAAAARTVPVPSAANAHSQLALAGDKLQAAAAQAADQSSILESFFTGSKLGAASVSDGADAAVPSALTPVLSGRATPPTAIALAPMAIETPEAAGRRAANEILLEMNAGNSKAPLAARLDAVAQLAKTYDSKGTLARIAAANPEGGATDYEVHRAALKALAEQGVVSSLRPVSIGHKAEILASLIVDKPGSAVFDYDDTLEKFREPISAAVAAGLKSSSDAGVKTAILTDRPDAKKSDRDVSVLDSIASMTPEQKAKLTVGANSGAKILTFDAAGAPVTAFDAALKFTDAQAAAITASSAKTADKFGRYDYNGSEENLTAFKWVRFLPLGMAPETVQEAAAFMQAELDAADAGVTVSGRQAADAKNPSYLTISLLDKTVGIKVLREERGFTGRMLLVGDSFFGTRMVDADMTKAAGAGSLTLAVGGLADPRIDNVFVWPTKGAEASAEILGALGAPKPVAPKSALRRFGDKLLGLIGWNAPVVKAPGADDAVNWRTFGGIILSSLPGMAAYMLVTISFYSVAVSVVGPIGYGVLMSLSPMAGIAAANIMGNAVKNMSARNAMALNTVLQAASLMLLPSFFFFGVVNIGTLLLGALASGWILSSMMTTNGAFIKVLFPAKQLGTINGATFMLFPAVQVVLGLFLGFGRYADMISPFLVFTGAALVNLLVVLPVIWTMIPNVKLTDAQVVVSSAVPAAPLAARAAPFVKKYRKEAALLAGAVSLFAAMTWWAPLAALPFLVAYPALKSSLPIAAALVYWITRTEPFRLLRKGHAGESSSDEKALVEKRGALAAEIADLRKAGSEANAVVSKEDALEAVQSELGVFKGRQLKAIKLMVLGAMMYYPLYLIVVPRVAELLAGPALKGEMIGQFLGALFFGAWISTAARTRFPDVKIPFTSKTVGAHRIVQGVVAALAGLWVFTKIAPGSELAAAAAVAAVIGLIALASRVTDRGWIKFAGLGFATIWLPFAVMMWPLAFPFLTVQTAMFLSLIATGLFNGPSFVSLIVYLQRNTARAENSRVTGIQGSMFNAAISAAYALLTIASGFLNPAYPPVLAAMGIFDLLAASAFWRAPKSLPGLPATLFTPKAPKK